MRSFVALFRTPTKGVSIDPNATEGAVVGENLFIRATDGSLSLFEPSSGVVTPASGTPTTVTITPAGQTSSSVQVGGSNSGYAPDQNPAAAPTNFDLDASMIAGLNNPQFPTLNYILVGDGAQWKAVPMTGDANIVASGQITDIFGRLELNSRVNALASPAPTSGTTDPLVIYLTAQTFGA